MNVVRITKEFHLDMAHALEGYDGACKNIHGHSYTLSVSVKGGVVSEKNHPKDGMVMDFSDLMKLVTSQIINVFDHALVLNIKSSYREFAKSIQSKIILLPCQPTCENLLIDFVGRIIKHLPDSVQLHHVSLRETPSSFAEWHAEDNAFPLSHG